MKPETILKLKEAFSKIPGPELSGEVEIDEDYVYFYNKEGLVAIVMTQSSFKELFAELERKNESPS